MIGFGVLRSSRRFLVFVLVIGWNGLLAASGLGAQEINLCNMAETRHFRCPEGTTIDVDDAICGDGRYSCGPWANQMLKNVCQGQQTCSNVGLANLFSSHCLHFSKKGIRVKYKCSPGTSVTCRANICADHSPGLSCPAGTNVHIRAMNCSAGSSACSRGSYVTMYSLCEGSERCAASGLRSLLTEECAQNANLLVDYACMPNFQLNTACSITKEKVLNRNFGVIKTPRPPKNSPTTFPTTPDEPARCQWIIPSRNATVKVTVHFVQPQYVSSSQVLRVAYFDCTRRARQLKTFSDVAGKGEEIVSCGPVLVTSPIPSSDGADDFLFSYQRETRGRGGPAQCLIPPVPPPPPAVTVPKVAVPTPDATNGASTLPSTASPVAASPKEGTDDKLDLKTSGYQNDESPEAGKASRSGNLTRDLKRLILYLAFGVVILILLVALIAVIISYRRLSKLKSPTGDSGEKLALWKQEDTPLDTFQHNGWPDHSGTLAAQSGGPKNNQNSTQVVATVHNNGIYDPNDIDNRVSNGSGISTFLPDKRDSGFRDLINTFQTGSFDMYSTVAESGNGRGRGSHRSSSRPDSYGYDLSNGDIYEAIDPDLRKQAKPLPPLPPTTSHSSDFVPDEGLDMQPLVHQSPVPSDDLHYCINGDEYAIVNKPRRGYRPQSDNPSYSDSSREHSPYVQRSEQPIHFRPSSGPYDTSWHANGTNGYATRGTAWREEL